MSSNFMFNGEYNKFNEFKRILTNELHGNNLFEHVFGEVKPPIEPENVPGFKCPTAPHKPSILLTLDKAIQASEEYTAAQEAYLKDKSNYQGDYLIYLEVTAKHNNIKYQYKKELNYFNDKQAKALGIILKFLDRHPMAIIQQELLKANPNPKSVYNLLSNTFEKNTEYVNVTSLYNRLNSLKYKENSDVLLFLQSIEDIFNNLTTCGETLSETFKYSILYNSFNHEDLNPIVKSEYKLILNHSSMGKKTFNELKQLLIGKYLELKTIRSVTKPFFSKDKSTDKSVNNINTGKTTKFCSWCEKNNHNTDDCFKLKKMKAKKTESEGKVSEQSDVTTTTPAAKTSKNDKVNSINDSPEVYNTVIGIDSMATCHVCNNEAIMNNIVTVDNRNITSFDGVKSICNKIGSIGAIDNVLYIPNSQFSLLSMAGLKDQGFTLSYNDQADKINLFFNNQHVATFKNKDKLYITDTNAFYKKLQSVTNSVNNINVTHEAHILDNRFKFPDELTNSNRRKCIQIADLHSKLNHINNEYLFNIIRNNKEMMQLSADDLKNFTAYAMPCTACCKGKMTSHPHYSSADQVKYAPGELVVSDLFLFNSEWFIIIVDVGTKFIFTKHLNDKTSDSLFNAVLDFQNQLQAHKVNIKTFRSDCEANYRAIENQLNELNIRMQYSSPGQHNVRAEVFINMIKNNARSLIFNIDHKLPKSIVKYAILTAAAYHNHIPSAASNFVNTPYQSLTGETGFDLLSLSNKPMFGEIAEFRIPNDNLQSISERSETGYIIQPLIHQSPQGVLAYIIQSRSIVIRSRFKVTNNINSISIADDELYSEDNETINNDVPVNYNNEPQNITSTNAPTDNKVNHEFQPNEVSYWKYKPDIDKSKLLKQFITIGNTSSRDQNPDYPTMNITSDSNTTTVHEPVTYWSNNINANDQYTPNKHSISNSDGIQQTYINLVREDIRNSLSVKSALSLYQELASKAIKDELSQLIQQQVFETVPCLPTDENTQCIPSQMIVKMKYLPSGETDKIKARLVAGGHKQPDYQSSATYAPTSSFSNVLLNLNLSTYHKRELATIDIKGAYLHASLSTAIYMKIDKYITTFLLELQPNYKQHLQSDGSIIVKLKKSLYGLKESANLWYNHISATLSSINLLPTTVDPCLFKGQIKDDVVIINLHVDDMLTSYKESSSLQHIQDVLLSKYMGITTNTSRTLSFLGLTIVRSTNNDQISLSQAGYIQSILEKYDIKSSSTYPSSSTLYSAINEESPPCDKHLYMSMITSLLYLAQRTRPDILKEIILLSSKNQSPTQTNLSQLRQAMQYINKTQQLTFQIQCTSLQIIAYADASFKSHLDKKSHSGGCIYIGDNNSVVKSYSKRQSITATSTFESELIAIFDVYKSAKYIFNCLSQLEPNIPKMIWKCDNKSTIDALTDYKPISIKNSHIDVKYYFLRELIQNDEISLEYINTSEMKADIMTKPLTGDSFYSKRWWILSTG